MNAGEQVEKSSFASAVGTDDAQNLPPVDLEFNVMDGGQSSEEFAQIPDLQKMVHRFFPAGKVA